MEPDEETELQEGVTIAGDDLAPVIENDAQVIPGKGGKLFYEVQLPDGSMAEAMKVAIIRPCMSKGRRVRGLAPIYEPTMLAENASVFTGWPMYLDHLNEEVAEELTELLQERGRTIKDLGGRIVRSWYDPNLTFPDDAERGYQKGGVVGEVIPQPVVRKMLEADPGILNVSINAWPKGAKVGRPSWNTAERGMVIEGIRDKPMGSVDWVFRGGAGGRPLTEEDRSLTVSVLESLYDPSREREEPPAGDKDKESKVKKLSEMTQAEIESLTKEQFAEALRDENPALAEALGGDEGDPAPAVTVGITADQLTEALNRQRDEILSEVGDRLEESDPDRLIEEREQYRDLADLAKIKIAEAADNVGLPKEWRDEISKKYTLFPSGPASGLLVEADTDAGDSAEEVLVESIRADVNHALGLIRASGGSPRVSSLGPSGGDPQGSGATGDAALTEEAADKLIASPVGQFLMESGDLPDDPKEARSKILETTTAEGN